MVIFEERLGLFLMGCAIGFILGYIVARLRDIKDELDEVKEELDEVCENITPTERPRDDGGFIRYPVIANIALFIVVAITVFAAFQSQKALNANERSQESIKNIVYCNQEYLTKTMVSLNGSRTFTERQAQTNVDLQKAQFRFFTKLLSDPANDELEAIELNRYLDALREFQRVNESAENQASAHPFPTAQSYYDCLNQNESGGNQDG